MKTDASHDNSQGCKFCLGAAYTSDPFEVKTKAEASYSRHLTTAQTAEGI